MKKFPLLTVKARPSGPQCPFGNEVNFQLNEGGCVWLEGVSGRGKTTLGMFLAGLRQTSMMKKLQIEVDAKWNPEIVESERCGVLFQQTTLLDELSVAGNLALALHKEAFANKKKEQNFRIKQLLDTVGLDYARDASKRPSELSGGMARRASLALQLAQRKHVIVLDEPFTGLDYDTGVSVAKELVSLRRQLGTAFILISHEHDLAKIVLAEGTCKGNVTVKLEPPEVVDINHCQIRKFTLFGISFRDRVLEKLVDYVFWSLPLILLAFTAGGLAISMLSSDTLKRIDVTDQVLTVVDREVKPMIKLLTGEEPNMMHMIGVRMKVRSMLDSTVPATKATLYAMGMAKLFVLEIGPLFTALLLAGRIGGSYAGKVATMQATAQNSLLHTLGVNPQIWSLSPALAAAVIAGPVLTILGTWTALFLGGHVGSVFGLGTYEDYWREVCESVFPPLRIRSILLLQDENSTSTLLDAIWDKPDFRATHSDDYIDALIELSTYPPIFHLLKAVTYMLIIMGVAEACARSQPNLTPRGVPSVITSSVVAAGLLIILSDWGFSRLWLKRY